MINGTVNFNVTLPHKNGGVLLGNGTILSGHPPVRPVFFVRLLTILYSLYIYIFIKRKKWVRAVE